MTASLTRQFDQLAVDNLASCLDYVAHAPQEDQHRLITKMIREHRDDLPGDERQVLFLALVQAVSLWGSKEEGKA